MLKQTLLSELSRLDETGEAMAYGVVIDQTVGATNAITVPEGQVFLMTHIHVQADTTTAGLSAAFPASPDKTVYGFTVRDTAGTGQWDISFLVFRRWQQLFVPENSPNWRSAAPGNAVVWKPKYPIPVPAGWTVKSTSGGEWGNQIAVYGYLVSVDGARTAGYQVSNSATDAYRQHGIASATPTTSAADLIAARTDQHIRILDVFVRVQPETNTTNKVQLLQTDGRVVFSWTNNNPGELFEQQISPEIILKKGQALQIVGTVAASASVVVIYEYVDPAEVPADHWWGCIEPELPTPTVSKVGTISSFPKVSTSMVCYYPKLDTTKTSPTQGYQHIVRGWSLSAQKDTGVTPDQTFLAISQGTSGGTIEYTAGGTTQGNIQISPTYTIGAQGQCVYASIDGLNIPCNKDTGTIWIDTLQAGPATGVLSAAATPTSGDADIDEWSVTMWGKTIPSKFTNPSNRGT